MLGGRHGYCQKTHLHLIKLNTRRKFILTQSRHSGNKIYRSVLFANRNWFGFDSSSWGWLFVASYAVNDWSDGHGASESTTMSNRSINWHPQIPRWSRFANTSKYVNYPAINTRDCNGTIITSLFSQHRNCSWMFGKGYYFEMKFG